MRPPFMKSPEFNTAPIATSDQCVRQPLSAIINTHRHTLKPPRDTSSPALSTRHTYRLHYKTLDPTPCHHLQSP
jgi:hypothetical protein